MFRFALGSLTISALILLPAAAAPPAPAASIPDEIYRNLRSAAITESFVAENIELKRDCATLRLKQGVIGFISAQMGKVTVAVFSGTGEFTLEPVSSIEQAYIRRYQNAEKFTQNFSRAVFVFTDDTYAEIRKSAKTSSQDTSPAGVLADFRDKVRKRIERPRSAMEAMMMSETMDNLEAEVLAGLYNPARPAMFNAFLQGKEFKDLRFFLRGLGALPDLPSPEEVALINVDPSETNDGILYHSHLRSEMKNGALPNEDKRPVQSEKYNIETHIENSRRMSATATIELSGRLEGERVVKFGLLQDLRVSSVKDAAGADVPFIQEDRKQDGSFYVVLPKGLKKGERTALTIAYSGDKVTSDAGGGSLYVEARTSWYPSLNSFQDRVHYDLTFKAPKKYTIVGSGKKVKEWKEGNLVCTQWQSEAPHAVAGFNAGIYKNRSMDDPKTGNKIDGYATTELPDYLRGAEGTEAISPSSLLEQAMSQTQASLQIFTHYFGPLPYQRIAVTQQPQFSMGQSWPELLYLPLSAFLDGTTRLRVLGNINRSLTAFVEEVTSHETSHQWWGHLIGWDTYRDQWLSEGFATFSASLFIQGTQKTPQKFLEYWERARKDLTDKNQFGVRSVDAGPIYLGMRANTVSTRGAAQDLMYLKGGYVLHMLRMMMADTKTGDADFIAMMKDFVESHRNRNASLGSFIEVVNRHVKPHMNVSNSGGMEWFFSQWVLGTEVPRYTLQSDVTPDGEGFRLKGTVTQSGVGKDFAMLVPIYFENQGRMIRLGRLLMVGSESKPFDVKLGFKPTKVALNAFHDVLELK